jgi:hypothetical protein
MKKILLLIVTSLICLSSTDTTSMEKKQSAKKRKRDVYENTTYPSLDETNENSNWVAVTLAYLKSKSLDYTKKCTQKDNLINPNHAQTKEYLDKESLYLNNNVVILPPEIFHFFLHAKVELTKSIKVVDKKESNTSFHHRSFKQYIESRKNILRKNFDQELIFESNPYQKAEEQWLGWSTL